MPHADIEEIRARWAQATPGPWRQGKSYGAVVADGSNGEPETDNAYGGKVVCESVGRNDAPFLANAWQDVAVLLDLVDKPAAPAEGLGEWAVVEVMGHRFHAGRVSEQFVAGHGFLKVEALAVSADGDERWSTVLYTPSALFSIRPGTEEQVRKEAPRWYPDRPAAALDPGRYPVDDDDFLDDDELDDVDRDLGEVAY